jgi:hypothetical protein
VSGADETAITTADVSAGMLVEGTNVIAAEVHQSDNGSSDLSFNLELILYRVTEVPVTIEVLDDDLDNDLMSDTWERANGIDHLAPNADADADRDLQTNRTEFLAGTDPQLSTSLFGIRSISRVAGNLVFDLISSPGRRYQLQLSNNLTVWSNLGAPILAAPTGNSTLISTPLGPQDSALFRFQLLDDWQ